MVAVFTRHNTIDTRTLFRQGTGRGEGENRVMSNVVTITTRIFLPFLVVVLVFVVFVGTVGVAIVQYNIRIGSIGPKNVLIRPI